MACFSRIATKITDGARLSDSLKRHGYEVTERGGVLVGTKRGSRIVFERVGSAYMASGDTGELSSIARGYAEIGVRDFAKRRGFAVVESDGRAMTLVNRRG